MGSDLPHCHSRSGETTILPLRAIMRAFVPSPAGCPVTSSNQSMPTSQTSPRSGSPVGWSSSRTRATDVEAVAASLLLSPPGRLQRVGSGDVPGVGVGVVAPLSACEEVHAKSRGVVLPAAVALVNLLRLHDAHGRSDPSDLPLGVGLGADGDANRSPPLGPAIGNGWIAPVSPAVPCSRGVAALRSASPSSRPAEHAQPARGSSLQLLRPALSATAM